ncbi:putative Nitroreductase family protein [Paratrimastix pyriformis]|uniref:Nitroreductase family protein n=1 Tax=Paratrimastix pyriformis TaxID=342808 RepID=A0ABQ8UZ55_9EUKA|nr:putative Nitroreductase family protein [Paratrimastix pyriformis]
MSDAAPSSTPPETVTTPTEPATATTTPAPAVPVPAAAPFTDEATTTPAPAVPVPAAAPFTDEATTTPAPAVPVPAAAPFTDESLVESIKQRTSWRKYEGAPLTPAERATIQSFLDDDRLMTGPFGLRVRVVLVDKDHEGKLGTYGVISGCSTFLVGKLAERGNPTDGSDFGCVFERLVLRCTQMGLGTVWLGGTFNGPEFSRAAQCAPGERVVIVSPVGHKTTKRGMMDGMMRTFAGSAKRLAWDKIFFRPAGAALAPLATPAEAGPLAVPLELARLAPSAVNRQPWRMVVHATAPATVSFWGVPDKHGFSRNDVGIAMCHFETAMAAAHLAGAWVATPPEGAVPPEKDAFHVATWRV